MKFGGFLFLIFLFIESQVKLRMQVVVRGIIIGFFVVCGEQFCFCLFSDRGGFWLEMISFSCQDYFFFFYRRRQFCMENQFNWVIIVLWFYRYFLFLFLVYDGKQVSKVRVKSYDVYKLSFGRIFQGRRVFFKIFVIIYRGFIRVFIICVVFSVCLKQFNKFY